VRLYERDRCDFQFHMDFCLLEVVVLSVENCSAAPVLGSSVLLGSKASQIDSSIDACAGNVNFTLIL